MKKLKEDLQKIKGMSFKEAVDHIFTYYGLAIAAIIFAIIFTISLVSSVIKNKLTVPVIQVAVQNELEAYYGSDLSELLHEAFPDSTGYREPLKCPFFGAGNQTDVYAGIQLTAYMAAGDIDAVICDRATVDYISTSGDGAVITDISDTVFGKKAEAIGLSPLYYVTFEFWNNQEASQHLLDTILSQE